MKYLQYIGIFLGATYGYLYRLLCGSEDVDNIYRGFNIYSITFLWVLPIVIAIIPILFARKEILQSKWKPILFPIISVFLFFVFTLSSGLEDWLCILLITFPFTLTAGLVGLLITPIIKERNTKKLYTIVLLPFLLSPIEYLLPNKTAIYEVHSNIEIEASPQKVWEYLIEVPPIQDNEYEKGFFNYIGVPRPIQSSLTTIDSTLYRIGYFSDGLKLYETIAEIDSFKYVSFNIHIDQSELRDLPTDKHLLQSDYFSFKKIAYQLEELSPNKTNLILSCQYTLDSKMNGYANFWAEQIIVDFETRLLKALQLKIE